MMHTIISLRTIKIMSTQKKKQTKYEMHHMLFYTNTIKIIIRTKQIEKKKYLKKSKCSNKNNCKR